MAALKEGTKQAIRRFTTPTAKLAEQGAKQVITLIVAKQTIGVTITSGAQQTVASFTEVFVKGAQSCQGKVTEFAAHGVKGHLSKGTMVGTKAIGFGAAKVAVKEGSKQAVKATAQGSLSTVAKVAQRAKDGVKGTLGASAVVETAILGYKTYQSCRQLESGEISKEEFQKQVMSDVGSAGGSLAGGTAGAAIGSVLFPGVGTIVGSVVGGMIGSYIGSTVGEATEEAFD